MDIYVKFENMCNQTSLWHRWRLQIKVDKTEAGEGVVFCVVLTASSLKKIPAEPCQMASEPGRRSSKRANRA
jgi:hypothetical protein